METIEVSSLAEAIWAIELDVSHLAMQIARTATKIALEDLQEAHREIMNSFYGGYSPVSAYHYYWVDDDGTFFSGMAHGYQRTYNLRYNSVAGKSLGGGGYAYEAKIDIGAANMDDYHNPTKRNPDRTFPASGVFDLMWNQGIRGLPPGYRGHVGMVQISAAPVGVGIAGHPHEAMVDFVNSWGDTRGPIVADIAAGV